MPKKKTNSKTRFPVFKKNSNWLIPAPNSLKDPSISSKPLLTAFLNHSWTRNWTTETFLKNSTRLWTTWCPCNKSSVRDTLSTITDGKDRPNSPWYLVVYHFLFQRFGQGFGLYLVSNPNFTYFVSVLESIYCHVNTASPHFITSLPWALHMIHMIWVILQEPKWQKEFHFDLKSFEHFEFVGIRQYFSAFD